VAGIGRSAFSPAIGEKRKKISDFYVFWAIISLAAAILLTAHLFQVVALDLDMIGSF